MKSVTKLALAVLLVCGSPFVAVAQDAAAPAAPAATTDANAMSTGNADTYGSLISSFAAGKMADLSTFTSASTVNCVMVSSLKGDAATEAAALDKALTDNAAAVTTLKTSVSGNADLKAKLEASNCPIDKVVAVTSGADGAFTVYVDDRT
jgi:hypothetical protein